MIAVSLQGQVKDMAQWITLAKLADNVGFDTFYVADHPGTAAAPLRISPSLILPSDQSSSKVGSLTKVSATRSSYSSVVANS